MQTPRYRHYIYTWDYGSEFEELAKQTYTEEYLEAEAFHMTEDCLLVNENIESISDFCVNIEKDTASISFTAETLYGSIEFNSLAVARPG